MPARFTKLRPAQAKPIDRLRALHTPLYPGDDTSAFCDAIVQAGLPAGIALAAARIADPVFQARAEYALRGEIEPGSWLGAPSLVALARLLALTKREMLADEVRRGELNPDLAAHIAATVGRMAPVRGDDPASTASTERTSATAALASDDLLSLYLVPGAFADYRSLLRWGLMLKRLALSHQDFGRKLLPRPRVVDEHRQSPWPDKEPPVEWAQLLWGRILVPAQITHRPAAAAPGAGSRDRQSPTAAALAKSGLSPADIRRIDSIAQPDAAAPAEPASSSAKGPDRAVQGKAAGRDRKSTD